MSGPYKYQAFISYSHADEAWSVWLHQKLERYRVPSRLVGRPGSHGPVPPRIGRCFRDQAELSAASHLGEVLQQALRDSEVLIVICSPRSASSHWVNEEIKFFRKLGRGDSIYALIVDGEPNAKDAAQECFPPALLHSDDNSDLHEPLAADARERADGKTDGFLKLAAGILGVEFDELRQRERRRRARFTAILVAGSLSVALVTTLLAISAYHARNEATHRRQQADELVTFMLGDLKETLVKVGRLDAMDATMSKAARYVGTVDIETPDTGALQLAAKTYTSMAETVRRRGNNNSAKMYGQKAVAFAGEVRRRQPSNDSDYLFAKAISALIASQVGEADIDAVLSLAREGLGIARKLVAASPNTADYRLIAAELADSLNVLLVSRKGDSSQAQALEGACVELLNPMVARADADSRYLRLRVNCRTNLMNSVDSPSSTALILNEDLPASQRFKSDIDLQSALLGGLGSAICAITTQASDGPVMELPAEAFEISRRLLVIEPDNTDFLRSSAILMNCAADFEQPHKRLAIARSHSDEAIKFYQELIQRVPKQPDIWAELMQVRITSAHIANEDGSGPDAALAEIAAGLALNNPVGDTPWIVESKLDLLIYQWLYAFTTHPDLAAQARINALKILSAVPPGDERSGLQSRKAKIKYLENQIEEGDRLIRTSGSPASASAKEIRDAMCLKRQRSGKICPPFQKGAAGGSSPVKDVQPALSLDATL